MKTLLKMGQNLVDGLERLRVRLAPWTDRLLDRLGGARVTPEAASQAGMPPFELEADAVMSRGATFRAQTLVRSALLVTVLLIVWAALAEIDEVTKGEAKVIPSRQL